jgi:hypothetical protein
MYIYLQRPPATATPVSVHVVCGNIASSWGLVCGWARALASRAALRGRLASPLAAARTSQ